MLQGVKMKKQPVNKLCLGFLAPLIAMLFVACSSTATVPSNQPAASSETPPSSLGRKDALWQDFKAKKSFDEMDEKLEEETEN